MTTLSDVADLTGFGGEGEGEGEGGKGVGGSSGDLGACCTVSSVGTGESVCLVAKGVKAVCGSSEEFRACSTVSMAIG